jgi:hypothetical protein
MNAAPWIPHSPDELLRVAAQLERFWTEAERRGYAKPPLRVFGFLIDEGGVERMFLKRDCRPTPEVRFERGDVVEFKPCESAKGPAALRVRLVARSPRQFDP